VLRSTGEVVLPAAGAAKMAATSEAAPTAGKSIIAGERGASEVTASQGPAACNHGAFLAPRG
jgi:hypothetical protein